MRVASLAELGAARRLVRDVNGTSVLVLMTAAGIFAVKNACTHLSLPLDQGRLIAGQLHCPHHGACFDLASGRALSGPAVAPLKHYPVTVDNDSIYIST